MTALSVTEVEVGIAVDMVVVDGIGVLISGLNCS